VTSEEIARRRLRNQRLIGAPFGSAAEAVDALLAVQAQDYAGAKWAIGQRVRGATDASVEAAFDRGELLRTHVLRPTWHAVTPADIRWLLALTAPRIKVAMAYYARQRKLDAPTLARSNDVLARALEGGRQRTRDELAAALASAGIVASGDRLGHIMGTAELDAVVCSGARRGKQFTYALFDERVPPAPLLPRERALGGDRASVLRRPRPGAACGPRVVVGLDDRRRQRGDRGGGLGARGGHGQRRAHLARSLEGAGARARHAAGAAPSAQLRRAAGRVQAT